MHIHRIQMNQSRSVAITFQKIYIHGPYEKINLLLQCQGQIYTISSSRFVKNKQANLYNQTIHLPINIKGFTIVVMDSIQNQPIAQFHVSETQIRIIKKSQTYSISQNQEIKLFWQIRILNGVSSPPYDQSDRQISTSEDRSSKKTVQPQQQSNIQNKKSTLKLRLKNTTSVHQFQCNTIKLNNMTNNRTSPREKSSKKNQYNNYNARQINKMQKRKSPTNYKKLSISQYIENKMAELKKTVTLQKYTNSQTTRKDQTPKKINKIKKPNANTSSKIRFKSYYLNVIVIFILLLIIITAIFTK